LGGQIRLRIDRQQISLTYQLFGFEFQHPRPSSSQEISKLECTNRRRKRSFESRAKLIIWARGRKYELNGRIPGWSKLLTQAEIEWLACEISEWLEMPISSERSSLEEFKDNTPLAKVKKLPPSVPPW